ncbi:MAG: putative O-glycosylation ligase, exosortase A system-associated [Porticoccus sp.]|nr:putative O-glycosylation ligase, exosortase A system-associated [Porticoccus sp.]
MRDILITLLVFGSLPFIFRNAYIGVLVWSWLSYMNPHRLAWGFAYNMPFAQIVALVLFVSFLFSKDKQHLPSNVTIFVWVLFILWMAITSFSAEYPEAARDMYFEILKVQIMTFITMVLITDIKKLNQLIWVIVCSIGYFSVKGGMFTLLTGGAFRVYGPPSSNISENNALAVAVLMVIPLMVYLHHITTHKWVRYGLVFAIVLSLISVLGSQSRGAIVAILGVGGFFWLKSKTKLVSGLAIILLASLLFAFMPESWHERMESIYTYQEDDSAMQRINSWQYSINVANDRLTGGGLQSWSKDMFAIYAPHPEWVFVAHSIYFSVLADHGWLGLTMFLLILGLTWRRLSVLIKRSKGEQNTSFNLLARMLQVSLVAYMTGGIFLSLSYFDLPWHLIAIAMLLPQFLNKLNEGASEESSQGVAKVNP